MVVQGIVTVAAGVVVGVHEGQVVVDVVAQNGIGFTLTALHVGQLLLLVAGRGAGLTTRGQTNSDGEINKMFLMLVN